jgi:hypothetical protein
MLWNVRPAYGFCHFTSAHTMLMSRKLQPSMHATYVFLTCHGDTSSGQLAKGRRAALAYRVAVYAAGICWHLKLAVQLGAAATSLRMPCRLVQKLGDIEKRQR